MIKLDRKKRQKKPEEEEEIERTEVDFESDIIVGKLEADHVKGGLEIREKKVETPIRKGPAMPSSEVLAELQFISDSINVPEIKPEVEKPIDEHTEEIIEKPKENVEKSEINKETLVKNDPFKVPDIA